MVKNEGSDSAYFMVKEEFLQDSPEFLLYTAIYQAKKDLRRRMPDTNPYTVRDSEGNYILLNALSSLGFLLASQEFRGSFSDLLDEIEEDTMERALLGHNPGDLSPEELEERLEEVRIKYGLPSTKAVADANA